MGLATNLTKSNQGTAAVLVAFHFPPLNVVAAQRGLRLARTLLDRYDTVYVVRQDWRQLATSVLDHEFAKGVLENPRLVCIDSQPMLARRGYSASPSLIHRLVGGVFTRLLCGPGVDWIPAISGALESLSPSIDIRMVVASGPPFVPFVACLRWAGRRRIPVILDYRDLWSRNPISRFPWMARLLVNRFVERRINRAATLMTTVSHGCKAMIERDAKIAPVRVLLNSPDASYRQFVSNIAATKARSDGEPGRDRLAPFRLVFTGQVYPHCTFAPVIHAALQLPGDILGRLEVHYFGGCSAMVRREFDRFGIGDLLVDHGMVSKAEAVAAILEADLLLSLVHAGEKSPDPSVSGLMTTKVYDYFLSGGPILNIGPFDAEVNRFAVDIGYTPFHSFVASDTKGLVSFLRDAIDGEGLRSLEPCSLEMPDFTTDFQVILTEAERRGATAEPLQTHSDP